MDPEAVLTVSAAVVTLTQLMKWAVIPDRYGPMAVLVLSLGGVAFWAWDAGDFERSKAFEYFAGWLTVSLASAGVYGFTRAGAEQLVRAMPPPGGGAGSSQTTIEVPKP